MVKRQTFVPGGEGWRELLDRQTEQAEQVVASPAAAAGGLSPSR
jgi:hypothetical protein